MLLSLLLLLQASVFSSSCNGEVCAWDLATNSCTAYIKAHDGFVRGPLLLLLLPLWLLLLLLLLLSLLISLLGAAAAAEATSPTADVPSPQAQQQQK